MICVITKAEYFLIPDLTQFLKIRIEANHLAGAINCSGGACPGVASLARATAASPCRFRKRDLAWCTQHKNVRA
jgi:hypothetical protein